MTEAKPGETGEAGSESRSQTYPPSWVNYLADWAARRGWSSWYSYLGVWLVLVGVQVGILWMEGVYPIGTLFPAQLFVPAMITLFLGIVHFLDRRAGAALATLHPALKVAEEEQTQLRYELTTMPAWPTVLSSLAMVAVIFLIGLVTGEGESSIEALAASPIAANLLSAQYWIGWWVFGAFIYHTIHQLRVINRIYTEHTHVSLFAMRPLYAFSGVTALTAVTLAIATYGWTALNPENLSDPVSIIVMSLITILALGVFAWPLLGTRRLIAQQKAERLDEVSLCYEATFAELHQRIDNRELEEVDELMKIISVLETERDMLKRISTWPWQPETLQFLMTALLLPLLLWIIQYVLQLVLGS